MTDLGVASADEGLRPSERRLLEDLDTFYPLAVTK